MIVNSFNLYTVAAFNPALQRIDECFQEFQKSVFRFQMQLSSIY